MKTIRMAFFLAALACVMITGCDQPLPACVQPVQLGTITYSCEDGKSYRCTDFQGNPKFPNEPCVYDDGKGQPIVCVERCGE